MSGNQQGNECDASIGASNATKTAVTLSARIFRSYLLSSIIPLLFIEITFIIIYWISSSISHQRNIAEMRRLATHHLSSIANREAAAIGAMLGGVEKSATIFASQAARVLRSSDNGTGHSDVTLLESSGGAIYSRPKPGQSTLYYSADHSTSDERYKKISRVINLDGIMIDTKSGNPLVSQIYFNSNDSLNYIYPPIDSISQYGEKLQVYKYNFYYEADARHNSRRKPVWTTAYLDPAGQGWLVSLIVPVWNGDLLEGVVGIDVTLSSIVREVLDLDLPWPGAYGMLVDRDGRIIALPPAGERDFGIKELGRSKQSGLVTQDTFKPNAFNITKRVDTRRLAQAMVGAESGLLDLDLGGGRLAAYAAVPGPGWHLILFVSPDEILADANRLQHQLRMVGYGMIGILLVFYAIFFLLLFWRARIFSQSVAQPLGVLEQLMDRISNGQFDQQPPHSDIVELDRLGEELCLMGRKLREARDELVNQEAMVTDAYARERATVENQRRFLRVMSHEFRTPLAIIDSCAQALARQAQDIGPAEVLKRSEKLRRAVDRMTGVLEKTGALLSYSEDGGRHGQFVTYDLARLLETVARTVHVEAGGRTIRLAGPAALPISGDPDLMKVVLEALLENARAFSSPGSVIPITMAPDARGGATLTIINPTDGLAPEDVDTLGQPFLRGPNAISLPGSGLGLYLARTLVERQQGQFVIALDAEGAFRVDLWIPSRTGEAHP